MKSFVFLILFAILQIVVAQSKEYGSYGKHFFKSVAFHFTKKKHFCRRSKWQQNLHLSLRTKGENFV